MKLQLKLFENPTLNETGLQIVDLGIQSRQAAKEAEQKLHHAFYCRWYSGKLIDENMDLILEECGTQENFAKAIGESPSVISNNKRGYKFLKEQGCDEWEDCLRLMEQKQIRPVVTNFEKIGTLLANPTKDTTQKEQIDKDQVRLEKLLEEANEILLRNEAANKPEVLENAFDVVEDVKEIKKYLDSFNPHKTKWKSEKYLNHVRSFGYDLVTDEPCESCDAHHTDAFGGSGGVGEKLPDYYAIPVSRKNHILIEQGMLVPSEEDILFAQFKCLSSFIALNLR